MKKLVMYAVLLAIGITLLAACGNNNRPAAAAAQTGASQAAPAAASGPWYAGATGTATGVAQGRSGEVTVNLTLENGEITGILVSRDWDGREFERGRSHAIVREGLERFEANESLEVDAVSGATPDYVAIWEAAISAVNQIVNQ